MPPNRVIRSSTCENCGHSEVEATGERFCHAMPPIASPIIVPSEGPPGFKVGFYTCFPKVRDVEWCATWKAKIHLAATLGDAMKREPVSFNGGIGRQPPGHFEAEG